MKRMIKGYLQETDFTNSGAGTATWCIASKDGKKYFIKSFLEITLLDEETAKNLPAPMVEAKRKSCVQFRIRKERLYNKLNDIQNGIFISPKKELLVYNGHFCAVTDYIESFEEANKIHKFSPRRKTILMRTLVLALKDLSDNHIVHSDLKPDNIIITYNQKKKPQLKIIDFDSGFFEDAPPHNVNEYHGDMVYFAPESMVFLQAEGESDIRLTCAVDRFAMGLLLHQMWCGMLPEYDKNECVNVAEALLLEKPIALHSSIPSQLQTIINGFLQEDPDKRMNYDQAYSLLGVLLETLPEDDQEIEIEEEPPKPPEEPEKAKTMTNVDVICFDTKTGKVIHSTTITIAAGHELTVVPKEIDGYKCLDEKCLIRVDVHGHADHSTIKFTYKKKKRYTNGGKKFFIVLLILGLIYCVAMYVAANKYLSSGDYEQAKQYMELFPFYKDIFRERWDDTNRQIQIIQNRRNEQLRLDNYNQAIDYYRGGYYDDAYNLFGTIDDSYKKTKLYKDFCLAHMNWPLDYYSTIYNNLSFEDARELLLSDNQIAFRFLKGTWQVQGGGSSFSFRVYEDDDGSWWMSNIPDSPGDGTWNMRDGIMYFTLGNGNEIMLHEMKIVNSKKVTFKSFTSDITYTLTRQ